MHRHIRGKWVCRCCQRQGVDRLVQEPAEPQIIGFLKQAESGLPVRDVCRQGGFSEPTFYKWRAKYGGMEADEARRLKDLEVENARLKKLLAEAHLDLEALKVGFGVKR